MDKLTKIVFNTLTDLRTKQINLASEAARKTLASKIAQQIKKNM